MRTQHTTQTSAKASNARYDDLVYFRFGKGGAGNLQKVRAHAEAKGCTVASVIRDLIGRGLANLEEEQAIIAAHKSAGAASVTAVGH